MSCLSPAAPKPWVMRQVAVLIAYLASIFLWLNAEIAVRKHK